MMLAGHCLRLQLWRAPASHGSSEPLVSQAKSQEGSPKLEPASIRRRHPWRLKPWWDILLRGLYPSDTLLPGISDPGGLRDNKVSEALVAKTKTFYAKCGIIFACRSRFWIGSTAASGRTVHRRDITTKTSLPIVAGHKV